MNETVAKPAGPFGVTRLAKGLLSLAGLTGVLAGIGFVIEQSYYEMLGVPKPPLGPTDYLLSAGGFLYDLVFRVVLFNSVILFAVFAGAVLASVFLARATSRHAPMRLRKWLEPLGKTITAKQARWIRRGGLIGLITFLMCLVVVFHIPLLVQSNIAVNPTPIESAVVQRSRLILTELIPETGLEWVFEKARERGEWMQQILVQDVRYRQERFIEFEHALFLVLLALATALLLNQLEPVDTQQASKDDNKLVEENPSGTSRPTVRVASLIDDVLGLFVLSLLAINVLVIPVDYGILLRSRDVPRVQLLLGEDSPQVLRDAYDGKIYYLVHESDMELTLYKDKRTRSLNKEVIAHRDYLSPQSLLNP